MSNKPPPKLKRVRFSISSHAKVRANNAHPTTNRQVLHDAIIDQYIAKMNGLIDQLDFKAPSLHTSSAVWEALAQDQCASHVEFPSEI